MLQCAQPASVIADNMQNSEVIVNLLHTVGHKNRVAHIVPFHDCHIAMAHEYDITRHEFESIESHLVHDTDDH